MNNVLKALAVTAIGLTVTVAARPALAQATRTDLGVRVPTGTKVRVVPVAELDSRQMQVGDTVMLRVARDVNVGRRRVVPEGTFVRARVTATHPRRGGAEQLTLALDQLLLDPASPVMLESHLLNPPARTTIKDSFIAGAILIGTVYGTARLAPRSEGAGTILGMGAAFMYDESRPARHNLSRRTKLTFTLSRPAFIPAGTLPAGASRSSRDGDREALSAE